MFGGRTFGIILPSIFTLGAIKCYKITAKYSVGFIKENYENSCSSPDQYR